VNVAEAPVLRRKLRRKEMVAFFEKLAPTVIAIEACGASHHCKNQTDRVETRFRNSR
jgi:transposase